ncbi:hypothetical protein N665_5414s0001 [Sinapis alba]|nr:hypothetical protein N665_5414s0001 [Sinapis alba]
MKSIPLMCIALVILLISFPATIKSDYCLTVEPCLREIPKLSQWKTRCCTTWSKPVTTTLKTCACKLMKQKYNPPSPGPKVRPYGSGSVSDPMTQLLRACGIAREASEIFKC